MRNWKRRISGLLAVLLIINGFSTADLAPLGMQKVFAGVVKQSSQKPTIPILPEQQAQTQAVTSLIPEGEVSAKSSAANNPADLIAANTIEASSDTTNQPLENPIVIYDPTTGSALSAPLLATPSGLTSSISNNSVNLAWDLVSGATGYEIYRDNIKIGISNANTYSDSGLTAGKTYIYNVKAYSDTGNMSALSAQLKVTATAVSTALAATPSAVSIPSNVNVSPTDTTLTVSWDAVADAQSYDVSLDGNIINVSVASYTFSGLVSNSLHTLKVRTYNPCGSYGRIGDINSDGVVDVIDYAQLKKYLTSPEESPSQEKLWVADLNGDGTINAIDFAFMKKYLTYNSNRFPKSVSDWSIEVSKYTMVATPVNLVATPSGISVDLAWDAVNGATGYEVYRDNVKIAIPGTNKYSDSGFKSKTICSYTVKALSTDGNASLYSQPVTVTTCEQGVISQNTTWTLANSPYILQSSITIPSGVTLTVEPGVIVKSANPLNEIKVEGKLVALGTTGSAIAFTTCKDSEYGGSGVTNSDTDYWYGINISEKGEFTGDYVKIRNGGGKYNNGSALRVLGKLTLTNSEISNSYYHAVYLDTTKDTTVKNTKINGFRYDGIYVHNTSATDNTMTIENNIIQNENYSYASGIYVDQFRMGNLNIQNNNINITSKYIDDTNSFPGRAIFINLGRVKKSIFQGIQNNMYTGNIDCNGIDIGGELTEDFNLNSGTYYLEQEITILPGKTMTIQPGVVVKIKRKDRAMSVYGKLIALGTSDCPIVFTTYRDSSYGGSGVETYWGGILVEPEGEFVGENIKIRYGSINEFGNLILTNSDVNEVYFDNENDATIKNSKIDNITVHNYAETTNGTITIENDTISNLVIQLHNGAGNVTIESNTISGYIAVCDFKAGNLTIESNTIGNDIALSNFGTGNLKIQNNSITEYMDVSIDGVNASILNGIKNNTYTGYGMKGIRIRGRLLRDFTLDSGTYLACGISIDPGVTLTIKPGVIIKVLYFSEIKVQGKLNAIGTSDNPIVFTSYEDSAYGGSGVTNLYQQPGDVIKDSDYWVGIIVSETGELTGDNVKIRYCYRDSLSVNGKLTLTNSEVSNSYQGICFDTKVQPTLKCNSFYNNNSYSVCNKKPSEITINAQNNYWGSANGTSTNSVSSGVDYSNWLDGICSTDQLGTVDLLVKELTAAPQNPQSGDEVVLKAVVTKVGAIALPDGFKAKFIIDDKYNYDYHSSIAGGECVTFTLTDNARILSQGNHTIKFIVDPLNEIAESDKSNNTKTLLTKSTGQGTGNSEYGSNQDETFDDYKPSISVLSNHDIIFSDQNIRWNYIGRDVKELLNIICLDPNLANGDLTAHEQMPEVQFWNTKILPNRHLSLTAQQLAMLYYIDPDGVKDYLTFCTDENVTYRSAALRNEVYKLLTGKDIEYYKHTINGWEPTTQTSGDGVRSNADMALTWDRPIDRADLATLGIAVGTILIALPEISMFIEGVEAFGFYNALTAYSYGVLGSQLSSWKVLTQLQNRECISDYGIEHIFFGTAYKGKASGYHYEGISASATIEAGTISEVDSFGVYRAKVLVDGIAKKPMSTFFPKNWTPQQVVNAIKEAFANKELNSGSTNMYQGVTNTGIKIEMMLDQNGLIKSAYPLWNP